MFHRTQYLTIKLTTWASVSNRRNNMKSFIEQKKKRNNFTWSLHYTKIISFLLEIVMISIWISNQNPMLNVNNETKLSRDNHTDSFSSVDILSKPNPLNFRSLLYLSNTHSYASLLTIPFWWKWKAKLSTEHSIRFYFIGTNLFPPLQSSQHWSGSCIQHTSHCHFTFHTMMEIICGYGDWCRWSMRSLDTRLQISNNTSIIRNLFATKS